MILYIFYIFAAKFKNGLYCCLSFLYDFTIRRSCHYNKGISMIRKYVLLLFSILCSSLSCFSQEQSRKDSIHSDVSRSATSGTQISIPIIMPAVSTSTEARQLTINSTDTMTFKISLVNDYWQLPWGYSSYHINNLIANDYAAYSEIGPFDAFSMHQTYPALGSITYMDFTHLVNLTSRLSVTYGFYVSKYNIGKANLVDFGVNFGADYRLYRNISLGFVNQFSLRQHIINAPEGVTSLFPHNRSEVNINFKPMKNVKFKIFLSNDP